MTAVPAESAAQPMTAGRLRASLRGVPDHAWVVCHDDDGHWTPTTAEFLPSTTANPRAQFVLSTDGLS